MRAIVLAILVAGCVGVAGGQANVRLGLLAEHAREFQGQVVRTCGWARNAFEDHSISVAQSPYREGGGHNPGLAVTWSSEARRTETNAPEWRCITGRVAPLCGHEPGPDELCLSNASPYRWKMVETPP